MFHNIKRLHAICSTLNDGLRCHLKKMQKTSLIVKINWAQILEISKYLSAVSKELEDMHKVENGNNHTLQGSSMWRRVRHSDIGRQDPHW